MSLIPPVDSLMPCHSCRFALKDLCATNRPARAPAQKSLSIATFSGCPSLADLDRSPWRRILFAFVSPDLATIYAAWTRELRPRPEWTASSGSFTQDNRPGVARSGSTRPNNNCKLRSGSACPLWSHGWGASRDVKGCWFDSTTQLTQPRRILPLDEGAGLESASWRDIRTCLTRFASIAARMSPREWVGRCCEHAPGSEPLSGVRKEERKVLTTLLSRTAADSNGGMSKKITSLPCDWQRKSLPIVAIVLGFLCPTFGYFPAQHKPRRPCSSFGRPLISGVNWGVSATSKANLAILILRERQKLCKRKRK